MLRNSRTHWLANSKLSSLQKQEIEFSVLLFSPVSASRVLYSMNLPNSAFKKNLYFQTHPAQKLLNTKNKNLMGLFLEILDLDYLSKDSGCFSWSFLYLLYFSTILGKHIQNSGYFFNVKLPSKLSFVWYKFESLQKF